MPNPPENEFRLATIERKVPHQKHIHKRRGEGIKHVVRYELADYENVNFI